MVSVAAGWGTLPFSAVQQGRELSHDFCACVIWQTARQFRLPRAPVEALDLIGQDDAGYRQTRWKRHFKRITLDLTRYRAEEAEAHFPVV